MPLRALLPAILIAGCAPAEPWARATVIADLSETIGGAKAMARPGDFLLENDRIRVAILGPRPSMGPGVFGGSLVDADLQRADPRYAHGLGNDLFAELIPTVNMNVPGAAEEGDVQIVADGADGEAAIVRVTAPEAPYFSLMDILWAALGVPDQMYVTDYVLEPGASFVRVRTTVTWGGEGAATEGEPLPVASADMPLLQYALERGVVMGDFFLPGGSVDVFTPGIGFDEELAVTEAYESGRNLFLEPITASFLAATGAGTSYAYGPADPAGVIQIPLFTSNLTFSATHGRDGDGSNDRFADGTAMGAERILAVGAGDVGSAVDALLQAQGVAVGQVEGRAREAGTGEPVSGAHVFAFRGAGADREAWPSHEWTTDVGPDTRPDGSFGGGLPPGTWTLLAHTRERGSGQALTVEVREGSRTSVALDLPRPGTVEVEVVDETGRPVPAKVSFFRADGAEGRDPPLGDGYMAGGVADVHHGAGAPFTRTLPPGTWRAVASRGPEYEIDAGDSFDLGPGQQVRLRLQVLRAVDTTGWVAADLHVHSDPSFDSGTSSEYRVRSMAAEGVEFFPSTDHDFLTDHAPTVEALGLTEWVRTAVGVEVSPIELGHFLGFFLDHDTLAEAGGAFDWTGMEPDDILDDLRALSDPQVPGGAVVGVAHPRDGILGLFDQYGLSPYEADGDDVSLQTPAQSMINPLLASENFTLDFDLLELFNAKRFELIRSPTQAESDAIEAGEPPSAYEVLARTLDEQAALEAGAEQLAWGIRGQVDDWFTLLNLGYRPTAVASSDTHSPTTTESGCARTWVFVDGDGPLAADPFAVAEALRAHRAVASYGPFVRFEADGQPVGSEVASVGPVALSIEVSWPSWFDVDRVELYENGTLIREWAVPDGDTPGFAAAAEVTPPRDAWYAVIAAGDSEMWPVSTGQERPYIALQDSIIQAVAQVGSLAAYLPRTVHKLDRFPVVPYALTNPIWIDLGGDGWEPPGLPAWLHEPVEPAEP